MEKDYIKLQLRDNETMKGKKEKLLFGVGMFFLAVTSVWFWAIGVKYILLGVNVLCLAQEIINK